MTSGQWLVAGKGGGEWWRLGKRKTGGRVGARGDLSRLLSTRSIPPTASWLVVRLIVIHAPDSSFGPKGWCALRTVQESGIGRDLYRMRSVVRRSGQDAPPTRGGGWTQVGARGALSRLLSTRLIPPTASWLVVRLIVIRAPNSSFGPKGWCALRTLQESGIGIPSYNGA